MAVYGQQPSERSEPTSQPPPIGQPTMAGYDAGRGAVRLGRTRKPFAVWLLAVITLGVYGMVWYYKINRELKEYNGQIEVSPGIALCNITVFGAITAGIAGIVSFCRTGGRINTAMRFAGAGRCSAVAGLLLFILVLGTGVCYYQSRLNRVWSAHGQA